VPRLAPRAVRDPSGQTGLGLRIRALVGVHGLPRRFIKRVLSLAHYCATARAGPAGASMSARFTSPLASDIEAFLEFQRALGHSYERGEFTLRAFDRFIVGGVAATCPMRASRLPTEASRTSNIHRPVDSVPLFTSPLQSCPWVIEHFAIVGLAIRCGIASQIRCSPAHPQRGGSLNQMTIDQVSEIGAPSGR
jgi:hypothetical protein